MLDERYNKYYKMRKSGKSMRKLKKIVKNVEKSLERKPIKRSKKKVMHE
jgi:hypothetical protein